MEVRPGGRFCQKCDKTVLDLTRMTRAEAEARMRRIDAPEVCVQLNVDRFGDAVFRVPPSRAPHWAGGLVLVTALTAGGCASEGEAPPEIVQAPPEEPGPPMQPVEVAVIAPPFDGLVTGPVPADELNPAPEGPVTPTAEQRALTAAKHRPVTPPHTPMRGGMALNWSTPGGAF